MSEDKAPQAQEATADEPNRPSLPRPPPAKPADAGLYAVQAGGLSSDTETEDEADAKLRPPPANTAAAAAAAVAPTTAAAASGRPPGGGGEEEETISDTDDEREELTAQQVSHLVELYAKRPRDEADASQPVGPAKDESGTDTDEDGVLIQKAKEVKATLEKLQPPPAPKARAAPRATRPGGGMSLKLLVDEGLLVPGENVLTVEYKGSTTKGTLTSEGKILYEGMTFESPSAYSIFLKRLVNPTRKADDGWKTVKYQGKFLEHYKVQLARRRFPDGAPPAHAPPPAKKPRVAPRPPAAPAQANGSMMYAPQLPGIQRGGLPSAAQLGGLPSVPAGFVGAGPLSPADAQPSGETAGNEGVPPREPTANGGEAVDGAARRSRRAVRAPSRHGNGLGDEHQMVPPEAYVGVPGSGAPGAQPFTLQVSPAVELLLDFHAHLSTNEVIGVLGGYFNPTQRVIRIVQAFPVAEVPTDDDSINVEMDPEDEFRARERIAALNMRCVGWYHSHPNFATMPSLVDIHNQVLQQSAHRDGGTEPYVAAIVGPYDRKLPTPRSSLLWFYVDHAPGSLPAEGQNPLDAGCTAMELQAEGSPVVDSEIQLLPQTEFQSLAKRYACMPGRPEMSAAWRDDLSRIQKLTASLAARLPASWPTHARQDFQNQADTVVMAAWNVYGPAAA